VGVGDKLAGSLGRHGNAPCLCSEPANAHQRRRGHAIAITQCGERPPLAAELLETRPTNLSTPCTTGHRSQRLAPGARLHADARFKVLWILRPYTKVVRELGMLGERSLVVGVRGLAQFDKFLLELVVGVDGFLLGVLHIGARLWIGHRRETGTRDNKDAGSWPKGTRPHGEASGEATAGASRGAKERK